MTGDSLDYQAQPYHSIAYIQQLVFDEWGVDPCHQKLILDGVLISGDDTLLVSDFNFYEGATLMIAVSSLCS